MGEAMFTCPENIVRTTALLTVANTAMHMAMVTASMPYAAAFVMACGFVLGLAVRKLAKRDDTVDTQTELDKDKYIQSLEEQVMKQDMELRNIQQIQERKYQVEIMCLKTKVAKLEDEQKKQQVRQKEQQVAPAPDKVPALTAALARVRARRGVDL